MIKKILRWVYLYLFLGFFYSLALNLWGWCHDKPLSFGFFWAESFRQFLLLFFWLFIMPALAWPLDMYFLFK